MIDGWLGELVFVLPNPVAKIMFWIFVFCQKLLLSYRGAGDEGAERERRAARGSLAAVHVPLLRLLLSLGLRDRRRHAAGATTSAFRLLRARSPCGGLISRLPNEGTTAGVAAAGEESGGWVSGGDDESHRFLGVTGVCWLWGV
jgi:hypothetical protein